MTEMRHAVPLLALAAALGDCMTGPDYVQPQIDAPQTFRYEQKDARELADTSGGSSSAIRCSTD